MNKSWIFEFPTLKRYNGITLQGQMLFLKLIFVIDKESVHGDMVS